MLVGPLVRQDLGLAVQKQVLGRDQCLPAPHQGPERGSVNLVWGPTGLYFPPTSANNFCLLLVCRSERERCFIHLLVSSRCVLVAQRIHLHPLTVPSDLHRCNFLLSRATLYPSLCRLCIHRIYISCVYNVHRD